jgi:hypothetical protein
MELDRRDYARTRTNLFGRYVLTDGREEACTVIDVSFGGIALVGPTKGFIGEPVIAHIDQLGRVEGYVVRHLAGGFAVRLTMSTRAAENFAASLRDFDSSGSKQAGTKRAGERRIGLDSPPVYEPDGDKPVEVIDLQGHGADRRLIHRPPVGTVVQLGRLRGKVAAHSAHGITIELIGIPESGGVTAEHPIKLKKR